jgi:hypothetical protein
MAAAYAKARRARFAIRASAFGNRTHVRRGRASRLGTDERDAPFMLLGACNRTPMRAQRYGFHKTPNPCRAGLVLRQYQLGGGATINMVRTQDQKSLG